MTAEAERYLRGLAEAELRRGDGVAGFEAAADVLVFLGAVDGPVAQEVLDGLATALGVRTERGRRTPGGLGGVPYPRWREGRPPTIGRPTGPVRIVPIGTTVPGGRPGETLHLLSVARAPDRGVTVTVAGLIRPDRRPGRAEVPTGPLGPYTRPDLGLTFTADGERYEQGWIDGSGTCDGVWWCLEVLLPERAQAVDRLEIATADGAQVVRVDVAGGAADVAQADGVGGTGGALGVSAAAGRAELAVDALAASLLWLTLWPVPGDRRRAEVAAMVAAVTEAGGLAASSPARRRYAALTASLAAEPSAERSAAEEPAAEPGALPPGWAAVLAGRDLCDGPEQAYSAAAVLPVLDGAEFAVTGLVSTAESATLRVLAWGWSPDEAPALAPPFVWWARDDAGRWHVGRTHWHSGSWQCVVIDVTLLPPLHPAATALEVIVTGRDGPVRATVPLVAVSQSR